MEVIGFIEIRVLFKVGFVGLGYFFSVFYQIMVNVEIERKYLENFIV